MDRSCNSIGLLFLGKQQGSMMNLAKLTQPLGGSTTPMMYASAKNFPNMGAGVFFGCMQCDGLFLCRLDVFFHLGLLFHPGSRIHHLALSSPMQPKWLQPG